MTTELLTNPGHSREDLRIVETAIRKGWEIPEQLLEALPKVAGAMALKGKPRDQIAAMKVLLAMKEQNESAEPVPQQVEHHHTHELGPITADNFAESKRQLAERIARLSRDS
jgi:hypothetical protein